MKIKLKKLCPVVFLIVLLSGCANLIPTKELPKEEVKPKIEVPKSDDEDETNIGEKLPVTRAQVAKMISFTYSDQSSIQTKEREINFSDTNESEWYDRYINTVSILGYMSGTTKTTFSPQAPLTLSQAQSLLDRLDPNNKTKIKITEETKGKPISYALWTKLFLQSLENQSAEKDIKKTFGISKENFILLATPSNNQKLKAWNMITERGFMRFDGLSLDSYIDKEISLLQKDGEVLALLEVVDKTPIITNSYITAVTNADITIFSGGVERTYTKENDLVDAVGKICDIKISQGTALDIHLKEEKIAGVVKRTDTSFIELENKGVLETFSDMKIYSVANGFVKWKLLSDLTVGADIADFIIADGKICAAIINKNSKPENVRISINTTGFKGFAHENVVLTATSDYTVTIGENIKTLKKGEAYDLSKQKDIEEGKRIYVKPTDETGKIEITSIARNWTNGEHPKYRGTIEVVKQGTGYFIVNELNIEQYLYAVVPSEMPTSYGLEALKVQAITARSYAYNQYYGNKYHKYGGNMDDSIQCQVYNNTPENASSIKAVEDTKGLCLTYHSEVVSANFFSTSSGMTANSGEVWSNVVTKKFPQDSPAYLTASKQYIGKDYGDVSKEENATTFLKDTKIEGYDKQFSWFRWNVEMKADEIAASINANLKEAYERDPSLIKTLKENNIYRSRDIATIGNLKDIEVTKRGSGGNIMEIKITGTAATILVETEYNIRTLIRPMQYIKGGNNIILNRGDGTKLSNYALMPSGFFVMEKVKDQSGNVTSIQFFGGGNGHGVGMSQNGVKGMIDKGFNYIQILSHYYNGTEIKNVF